MEKVRMDYFQSSQVRKRENACVLVSVCVCVRERERVRVRVCECVCVSECVRKLEPKITERKKLWDVKEMNGMGLIMTTQM